MTRVTAILLAFLGILPLLSSRAYASLELQQKTTTESLAINILVDHSSISGNVSGNSFTGQGLGLFVIKGITNHWGLGGGVRTSFATLGAQSALVALNLIGTWAPFGGLSREIKTTELDGKTIGKDKEKMPSGPKLHLLINQYFFNGSRNTVPYSGPGFIIDYTLGVSANWGITAGMRYDQLMNGSNSLTATGFFAAATIFL